MGFVLIFTFKVSKAFCWLPPHWNPLFTLVNACKGDAIREKFAINFLQYYVSPMKLLTSVTFVGFGQFTMT
jgi:hypothetical protein